MQLDTTIKFSSDCTRNIFSEWNRSAKQFCESPVICLTSVRERREMYKTMILPYVRPEVWQACEDPAEDELTIHIRNGDVATALTGNHPQPPCLYFHRVIETGNGGRPFTRLQLLYHKSSNRFMPKGK